MDGKEWMRECCRARARGYRSVVLRGKTTTLDTGNGVIRGVHKLELTGLSPGTAYTYRVGDGSENGWSEAFHFMTEAQGADHFTFINVTDSQGITEQDFELWGNTLDQAFKTFPGAQLWCITAI